MGRRNAGRGQFQSRRIETGRACTGRCSASANQRHKDSAKAGAGTGTRAEAVVCADASPGCDASARTCVDARGSACRSSGTSTFDPAARRTACSSTAAHAICCSGARAGDNNNGNRNTRACAVIDGDGFASARGDIDRREGT